MKMTAPDRIEEDPLQEEQQAITNRENLQKSQVAEEAKVSPKKTEEVIKVLSSDAGKSEGKNKKKTNTKGKDSQPSKKEEVKEIVEVEQPSATVENSPSADDGWNVVNSRKK